MAFLPPCLQVTGVPSELECLEGEYLKKGESTDAAFYVHVHDGGEFFLYFRTDNEVVISANPLIL